MELHARGFELPEVAVDHFYMLFATHDAKEVEHIERIARGIDEGGRALKLPASNHRRPRGANQMQRLPVGP